MTDILPTLIGDGGPVEAQPVVIFDINGDAITSASGIKDTSNSTTTALGSAGTFTGPWVTNTDPQIGFNLVADQPGELFVEFSPDGGSTVTLSKKYAIAANEARFDALVKLPGRSHRLRYVNGASAQGSFVLLTATGDGLFPFSKSDRDEPVFVAFGNTSVTATTYAIFVDLDDTTNFPHSDTGRIDLYSTYFQVDRNSTAAGTVRLGVITRIDGTDADVAFVQGVSFTNSSDRTINRDRVFPAPMRLGQSSGALTRAGSSNQLNIAAINTGVTLPSAYGNVTPAVGDLVIEFARTAGEYSSFVSGFYAGNVIST